MQSFFVLFVQGQGCSDAGFCTLNGLKATSEDSTDNEYKNHLAIGFSSGAADYSISILSAYLEYHHQFSKKFALESKLTGINQKGSSISSTGISDLYLTSNYLLAKKTTAILGLKVPLNDGNKQSDENLALPMDYQSSLGTLDLILGLRQEIQKLKISIGLQQPLTQNNNQFLSQLYPIDSPLRGFQSTNNYKRSGDVLLRLSYPFNITKHFTVSPSTLFIYHLQEDKFTDILGITQSISGSSGLTFNGTLYLDYNLSKKSALAMNVGKPFITRKSRPDGLTREYIITLEYKFKF